MPVDRTIFKSITAVQIEVDGLKIMKTHNLMCKEESLDSGVVVRREYY